MSKRTFTVVCLIGVLMCAVAAWIVGVQAQALGGGPASLRVGTFSRTDLVVAYYRSDVHDQWLKGLGEQRDKAKAAGNADEVQRIETLGGAAQELAHRQLAGEAALSNILESLQEKWPDIARESGVSVIVERPLYHDPSVELVDITKLLVAKFAPAEHGKKQP